MKSNKVKNNTSSIVKKFSYFEPSWTKAVKNTLSLLIMMVPILLLIKIFQELNLLNLLAYPFTPIMEFVGLPPSYALAWIGGIFNNNYTAFSIIIVLFQTNPLTYEQVTVISLLTLVCHSIIVESTIAYRLGVNPYWCAFIRFFSAILLGFLTHIVCQKLGILQDVVSNTIIAQKVEIFPTMMDYINSSTFMAYYDTWLYHTFLWLLSQAKTVFLIFFIIFIIFVMVQILKDLKILDKLNDFFIPFCRILKITKSNSLVTLLSFIIGLSYGWGLLKDSYDTTKVFRKEQAFNILTFLSIIHAAIEDNLIFIILGASFWVLVVIRFSYSLLLVWVMHAVIFPRLSDKIKYKYFYYRVKI